MLDFRFFVHYGLHFIFPFAIAYVFFRERYFHVWLIFCVTMLVDLDHLVANPIFDANRCSIQFHPLHSHYAIAFYALGLLFTKLRIVSIGLLFHMFTDWLDCVLKS